MSAGTVTQARGGTAQLVGLRRHLWAEVVAGEAAYLFSESGVTALTGAHVEQLVPLLDGTRDLAALFRDMPVGTAPEQVEALLTRLIEAGLVTVWPQTQLGADPRSLA